MSERIGEHIRSNVVGYIALFLALSMGTAYATHPGGANTISSADLINGAVRTADINDTNGVRSADVRNDTLAGGGLAATDLGPGAVATSELVNGAVSIQKLAFDPATQPELNAHKSSADHDGRYRTESELSTSDASPPNAGSNFLHWDLLDGVPAAFADGSDATGADWSLAGNSGTTGANFLGTTDPQPLNLRVNDARGLRLEPATDGTNQSPNVIGGIADNAVTAGVYAATIAGGGRSIPSLASTANRVTEDYGTVGGGANNQAGDDAGRVDDRRFATVGGGTSNTASRFSATVGGGNGNTASSSDATVGGGSTNTASGAGATVGGGLANTASGFSATVGGGAENTAAGDYSLVAGRRAKNTVGHPGVFLFADSNNRDLTSVAPNEFAVRASGGFRFGTNPALTTGCDLPANSGTFSCASDVHTKEGFAAIDPGEILDRLAQLPVSAWRFRGEDDQVRHIGPTSQAFFDAFGLGADRRSIGLPDANGVAFAAIKGLNERVEALGGSSAPAEASGLSVSPALLAGIAALGLTLAAALGAAVALRWSGRLGGRLAAS
jgi:endosialidase-like protein